MQHKKDGPTSNLLEIEINEESQRTTKSFPKLLEKRKL